jgi:hypothetical protein
VALLPLLLVLVLAAAAATGATIVRRSPPSAETTVAAARRHAALTSSAALVLAGVVAVGTGVVGQLTLPSALRSGVTALSVPLAFGIAHTAVLLLGEFTWPRPEGDVRRARLVRRGVADAAPRWLVRAALAAAAAAVLVLVAGGLLASPDGRSITVPGGDGLISGSASPFVGWAYGTPAAIGVVALTALTVAGLWVVADRPAVVTADERIESTLRAASAHRVLRGAVAATLVVIGGMTAVSGQSVRSAATGVAETAAANGLPVGTAATVLPWVGGVLAVLGLVASVAGLVVLCVRAPGVPADEPVAA